jgi:hypothetical protein
MSLNLLRWLVVVGILAFADTVKGDLVEDAVIVDGS